MKFTPEGNFAPEHYTITKDGIIYYGHEKGDKSSVVKELSLRDIKHLKNNKYDKKLICKLLKKNSNYTDITVE